MTDVYYSPEDLGLELVGMLDEPDMSYEFHMLGVWKDSEGNLYWAEDSGCSCPTPFEDYRAKKDLTQLTSENYREFADHAKAIDDDENCVGLLHVVKQALGIFEVDHMLNV